MAKIIRAVAGLLISKSLVLMAQRPYNKSHSGYWEFPGGKIEHGESISEALIRELKEEIGILVIDSNLKKLTSIKQSYPNQDVYLDVIIVNSWVGKPIGIEGQTLYWQDIHEDCIQQPLLLTTQRIFELLRDLY
jgi:8-oxo-dGTP diphosphatase